MKTKDTFDMWFWLSLIIFAVIIVGICFLPSLLTKPGQLDFSETGQIGDTIGGILSPFVAIAAAILTFIAFWVQFKANIQQRHDIAIERFESNLFEMIHVQQDIVNGLLLQNVDGKGNIIRSEKGRDVFQFAYEDMPQIIKVGDVKRRLTLKNALSLSDDVKHTLSTLPDLWFLDHYFRHLYRIFKYIDDANIDIIEERMKKNYAGIVRATLSPYELVMLYYNGFSHPRFKHLMDEYNVLENIRPSLLASITDSHEFEK